MASTLYVVADGVSGPPGFGVTGGPSFCPPTGFTGGAVGAAWAMLGSVPAAWAWRVPSRSRRWLGLRETRGHETRGSGK